MTKEETENRVVAKMFGAMLMAIGGLIAGLCGLCSAFFLFSIAASDPGGVGGAGYLAMIVGGIPIAVGGLIFMAGRKLWRG